ncbi:MAG: peptidoglycan bridge formation glycyltransferase FemA/FemB family protein [Clostridia bacterium]
MPILDKENKEQVEKYEKFIKNYNLASAMQDLSWGKLKFTWIQEAVYLEEKGEIIAAMTILLEKVPHINSYLMYAPHGPVCDIYNIELVEKLVKEADNIAKKYNAFALKFDPEVIYDETLEKKYINKGFKIIGKGADKDEVIQPLYNMVLDIENTTEDNLMKRFSEKTRYNIRLSGRKGVKVYHSRSKEDLQIFYAIYKVTTLRDKIGCRAYEYFEKMLEVYGEEHLRIYIAEHENDKLSAAIALNYGGKLFYIYGASSNEKRNLMPNYAMQWEMIKWGLETGCKKYDFGGVIELDKDNGLFKFKNGFCKKEGVSEYIGEITKVYNQKIYLLYSKVLPNFKKMKRKFRKIK